MVVPIGAVGRLMAAVLAIGCEEFVGITDSHMVNSAGVASVAGCAGAASTLPIAGQAGGGADGQEAPLDAPAAGIANGAGAASLGGAGGGVGAAGNGGDCGSAGNAGSAGNGGDCGSAGNTGSAGNGGDCGSAGNAGSAGIGGNGGPSGATTGRGTGGGEGSPPTAGSGGAPAPAVGGGPSTSGVAPPADDVDELEIRSRMTPDNRVFMAHHPWPDPMINVCFEVVGPDALTDAELNVFETRVKRLLRENWQRVAHFEFDGWKYCDSISGGIQVLIATQGPSYSEVGYPGWYKDRDITLVHTASDAEVLYYFGRALGFEHEYGLDQLPGSCTRCASRIDCADQTDECLPSGFCGRTDDHESIMAPPGCGGIEPIRKLSPWDVMGARRAYNEKPMGTVVAASGGCLYVDDAGSAYADVCVGFEQDMLAQRFAASSAEVDQFVSRYFTEERCLEADAGSLSTGVHYSPCDPLVAEQRFSMDAVRIRGLGGMCVVAESATAFARLVAAECGSGDLALELWDPGARELRLAGTQLCATVEDGVADWGTSIVLAECGIAPEWQAFELWDGRIQWQGDWCFDVNGGLPIPGSPLTLWSTNIYELENDNFYFSGPISMGTSGSCLTLDKPYGQLWSAGCDGSVAQEWDYHF